MESHLQEWWPLGEGCSQSKGIQQRGIWENKYLFSLISCNTLPLTKFNRNPEGNEPIDVVVDGQPLGAESRAEKGSKRIWRSKCKISRTSHAFWWGDPTLHPVRPESLVVLSFLGLHSFPLIKPTAKGYSEVLWWLWASKQSASCPHWVATSQFPLDARINHPGQYRDGLFSLLVQQHKADWPRDSLSF